MGDIVKDRADWLLDAVATSTQDRQFLRGDEQYNTIVGEAVLLNGEKAMRQVEKDAFLAGVKAGLEAAMVAVWKASLKRKPEDLLGLGYYLAGAEIAAIDPATVKPITEE